MEVKENTGEERKWYERLKSMRLFFSFWLLLELWKYIYFYTRWAKARTVKYLLSYKNAESEKQTLHSLNSSGCVLIVCTDPVCIKRKRVNIEEPLFR